MRSRTNQQIAKIDSGAPSRRLSTDTSGATAVEFGLVALPFFTLIFILTGFALRFFVTNSLDKGMDTISRQLRTGQAQKANMTVNDFKTKVCQSAGSFIDCNKTTILVNRPFQNRWENVVPQPCFDTSGAIVTNPAAGTDLIAAHSGGAGQIVLVTICYQWDLAGKIPFMKEFAAIEGLKRMQTSTAFRTEPYN
jgi:Flp pilus assembly protein TadG